jgi:hypothetical protein
MAETKVRLGDGRTDRQTDRHRQTGGRRLNDALATVRTQLT